MELKQVSKRQNFQSFVNYSFSKTLPITENTSTHQQQVLYQHRSSLLLFPETNVQMKWPISSVQITPDKTNTLTQTQANEYIMTCL